MARGQSRGRRGYRWAAPWTWRSSASCSRVSHLRRSRRKRRRREGPMVPDRILMCAFVALLAITTSLRAQPARPSGPEPAAPQRILDSVGIDQKLGQKLPLDATFRDEAGKTVRLGDLFTGKPVVLSLVYYECPSLC